MTAITTSADRAGPLSRALCLAGALSIGAALLAKVYGLASMRSALLGMSVPGLALGTAIAWRGRNDLTARIAVGAVGGVLGTLGYDLLRVPFSLAGYRVYTPIDAFGLWILDAAWSSRATEAAGWAYHDATGVTFGIAYALIARPGTAWAWGVVWAFLLETVAVLSPFGRIFGLRGNIAALAIAYWGHVGYGIPLGWMVRHADVSSRSLAELKPATGAVMALVVLALLVLPVLVATPGAPPAAPRTFSVRGDRLEPSWLRIRGPGAVRIANGSRVPVSVVLRGPRGARSLAVRDSAQADSLPPAIYQLFVATAHRSHSSFLMVEPVESKAAR